MNELNHVAIIMDGNGRWGLKKKGSRNYGHLKGIKTVEINAENIYLASGKFIFLPESLKLSLSYSSNLNNLIEAATIVEELPISALASFE